MKIKTIFCIGLFLLTLISITGISAETVNFGNNSFTMPEGFEVYSVDENQIALLRGNTTVVGVYTNESKEDAEVLKEYRLKLGYTLTGEADYDFEGMTINQQNYTKDNTTVSVWMFTKNDKQYRVAVSVLNGYSRLEDYDDIVTEIIHSLE